MLIYLIPSLMQAFTLITTLSALPFMFVWSIILLSYLAYRKSRQARRTVCWPFAGTWIGVRNVSQDRALPV